MPPSAWMSWEAGVDLAGGTQDGLPMPNAMVHVARPVHTPVGMSGGPGAVWAPCGIYAR